MTAAPLTSPGRFPPLVRAAFDLHYVLDTVIGADSRRLYLSPEPCQAFCTVEGLYAIAKPLFSLCSARMT